MLIQKLNEILKIHSNIRDNIPRSSLIQECFNNKEAILTKSGALATWRAPESTGRSPKDTVVVRRDIEKNIDWNAPNNIAITEETFDLAWQDALKLLSQKEKIYISDRVIGADPSYALPVKAISDKALPILFTYNMFRNVPDELTESIFAEKQFNLLILPYDKLDRLKFEGRLRKLPDGQISNMMIAVDFERHLGLVYGSSYCGSAKKLMFTVMNYYLPAEKILPLHCSANEGKDGDITLLLGLSGTGKTSLSADPYRALLGDDEHGWSNNGIANFEGGCYAKLIDLDPEKEPEIYKACFGKKPYLENGAIIEDAMVYPDGSYDLFDSRYTPNSRGSYPLEFLSNIKQSSLGNHPRTILFLTADANGVLPPISKLSQKQTMLWFLMGYTSKLAGTETGIIDPLPSFSRFFGAPFMPRIPEDYTSLLWKLIEEHRTNIFLVNTGWSGGPYGVGKRMDIKLTRKLVNAALNGSLNKVEYEEDSLFHLNIPKSCPGVPSDILFPKNTWEDKVAFDERAQRLVNDFKTYYDNNYLGKIDPDIQKECPGY
ncbi:MAG: Phosphoenolpyruvate carboxykinase [ATP] [Candidatus Heimdallarchaeota archaeon LC_3]|nr:MAG: Phosphoenolpyruvate carboxykinase [ATP] [Candidatus Heimdallarchaeota archaeon LC_3]